MFRDFSGGGARPGIARWPSAPLATETSAALGATLVMTAGRDYDQQIDCLARQHPDYVIMKALPSAGRALAPRLFGVMEN